ncbi:MAG: hypothetical protein ACXWNR_08270, partial [Candidatus Limnocylindrales bacterium]
PLRAATSRPSKHPPVGAPTIYRQLVAWRTRLRAGRGSVEALPLRACVVSTVGRLGLSDG